MIDRSQFNDWRELIAGREVMIRPNPEDAMPGYFRLPHSKGGNPDRIAIWRDERWTEGTLPTCIWGDTSVNVEKVWPFCARYPVDWPVFQYHEAHGTWPDGDPLALRTIGHNSSAVSDAEQIKSQIEACEAGVVNYATIADDNQFAASQTLRSRLLELSREADAKRKELKKPHQDAADDVDTSWMPLVKGAKAAADKINAAQNTFTTLKLRTREAAERKIADDKAALEAKGVRVPDLAPPPPLPTKIRGASGRGANVGTRTQVKSVTKWTELAQYFCEEPTIQAALLKLANKALENGATSIPGCEVEIVGRVK